MHHGADARGRQLFEGDAVLLLHLRLQRRIATLQAAVNIFQTVRPDAVFQPVFPVVGADRQRVALSVRQHGLDTCGTEFNAQHGLTGLDEGPRCIFVHDEFLLKRKKFVHFLFDSGAAIPTASRKKERHGKSA